MIAKSVDDLHSSNNNLNKDTALDENGNMVNGRTEKPNMHDILTGSRVDGTAFGPRFFTDMTCGNWTKSDEGATVVGHHDRIGPIRSRPGKYPNFAHVTKGCSQEARRRPAEPACSIALQNISPGNNACFPILEGTPALFEPGFFAIHSRATWLRHVPEGRRYLI